MITLSMVPLPVCNGFHRSSVAWGRGRRRFLQGTLLAVLGTLSLAAWQPAAAAIRSGLG